MLTKKLLCETAHSNDNCANEARFKAICEKWKRFNGKHNDVDQNRTPLDVVRSRFNESILKFDDHCSVYGDQNWTNAMENNNDQPDYTSSLRFNGTKAVKQSNVTSSAKNSRSSCSSPANFHKLDANSIEAKNLESLGLLSSNQFYQERSEKSLPKCSSPEQNKASISNDEQRNTSMRHLHYQNSTSSHEGITCSSGNLFLPLTPAAIDMNSCLSANNCKRDVEGLNVIECNSDMTHPTTLSSVSTSRATGRRETRRQLGTFNDNKSNECLNTETCTTLSDELKDQEGVDSCIIDKRRPFSLKFSIKKWFGPGGNPGPGESNSLVVVSDHTDSVTDEMTEAQIHETYIRGSKNYSTVNFNASQDASSTELTSTSTPNSIAMKCTESAVHCTTSASTSVSVNTSDSCECASSLESMELPANVCHESVITDSQPISETSKSLLKTQTGKQSRSFTDDKSMNSVSSDQGEQLRSLNKVLSASKEASETTPDLSRRHSPAPSEISKTESALLSPTSDISKTESTNHDKKLTEKRNNSSKQSSTTSHRASATNENAAIENASNDPTNANRVITPPAVDLIGCVSSAPQSMKQLVEINRDVNIRRQHYIMSGVKVSAFESITAFRDLP